MKICVIPGEEWRVRWPRGTCTPGILATGGMNQADRGRHAGGGGIADGVSRHGPPGRDVPARKRGRWAAPARSLLLAGQVQPAQEAAERSMAAVALSERWNAFLPWPQVLHAQCLAQVGRWDEAGEGRRTCVRAGLRAGRSLLGRDGRPGAGGCWRWMRVTWVPRSAADGITDPDLQARVPAVPGGEPDGRGRGKGLGGTTMRCHEHSATARLPAAAAGDRHRRQASSGPSG